MLISHWLKSLRQVGRSRARKRQIHSRQFQKTQVIASHSSHWAFGEVMTLEDRTLLSGANEFFAQVDVPFGKFTQEQIEQWESVVADASLSTQTPLPLLDGSHESDILTFVLDFKEPGEADTSDVFSNVVGTFDVTEYGFSSEDFDTIAQAILAEVEFDYFGIPTGTTAIPDGEDLRIDFLIGDIGTAPAGVSEYFYIQIGTGITGTHTGGTLGVAAGSSVRNSSGGGPGLTVGSVVGSVFTDAIVNLGGLTPSDALTSGNLDFTKHAIAGTMSHEIAHTLSLSHLDKAGAVTPNNLPPLMGTGELDLPNQDRISDREFSISGTNGGQTQTHIAQLAAAVGTHDTGGAVNVALSPETVTEDGAANLVYTFTRTGDTTQALTVNFQVAGGAVFGTDYTQTGADTFSATTGTVTFAAGSDTATVTIDPTADGVVEADENVQLTVVAGSGYAVGTSSTATGTIQNEDTAIIALTASNATEVEGANGTTKEFTFLVILNNAVQGGFDLAYATNDGTATAADGDYADNDGTLKFTGNAGETKTITVQVNGDAKVETDEMFQVALGAISGLGTGIELADLIVAGSPQTGTIQNDDSATVTLAPLSAPPAEGTGTGTTAFTFSVTLDNAVQGGFGLAYSTDDDTATVADGDYVDNDGTLQFVGTAGEIQTITVLVNQDAKVEADEMFRVALGALSGLGIDAGDITLAGSLQTGTILNDDSATVTLAAGNVTQVEGSGGGTTAFTFSVTLDNAVQGGFGLAYLTNDGTASEADGDYVDNDGTLLFAGTSGEIHTITVVVNHDSKVEADEVFEVALGALSNLGANIDAGDLTVAGSPQSGTIQNDDSATVTLVADNATQAEGTMGGTTAFTFLVSLDNAVQGGFDLAYNTNDGTATVADGDYVNDEGTLQFAGTAGEQQTITVRVNHDAKVEADEVFQVALGALSGLGTGIGAGNLTVTGSPQTGTIQNDDGAAITLAATNANQVEGTNGTTTEFTFEVTLNSDVGGSFDLAYTTNDGTATVADGDYVGNNGTLLFAGTAGETKTITVQVKGDTKVEADETFRVTLGAISNLGAGVDPADLIVAGSPQTATIQNDDSATVTLAAVSAANLEDDGEGITEFIYSVMLDSDVQGGFDLAYSTSDDTAMLADGDYVDNDGTLQFAGTAGETKTITVLVNHDGKVEADEVFQVTLGALSDLDTGVDGADIILTGSPQTGTIQNDDAATVTLTTTNATQVEGTDGTTTEFTFEVTLNSDVGGSFDLAYTTNDGTATVADGDYVGNNGTLQFAGTAGETHTITVQVNGDTKVEADETFSVVLGAISNLGAGVDPADISIAGSPQTATIQNDDSAAVTLAAVSATQVEGADGTSTEFEFSVTLDNAVQGGFGLAYHTNDGTATVADGDYLDNDGDLLFAGTAGEKQTIIVQVNGDAKVEADEMFQVALGALANLGAGIDAGDLTVAGSPQTGTIQNDDAATVTLTATNATQVEGTGLGTTAFTFTVTLSHAVQGGFDLAYTTDDDTATAVDGDYVDNDGTLEFIGLAGERQTITVLVDQDAKVEADEAFRVALGALSDLDADIDAADIVLEGSPLTATIQNDDTATVTLASVNATQMEGTGGMLTALTFSITLSHAVQGGFNLTYNTNDGTAKLADGDYIDNDGTLSFVGAAGESKLITVLVNPDSTVEADETFSVALGSISNLRPGVDIGGLILAGSPQTGTIQNDDTATITLASVNANQAEGTDGTTTAFTFSVTLDNAVQGGFDLDYLTNDGTATIADADYVDNDGTLSFAGTAGEMHTITVLVNHDAKGEGDEEFQVALAALTNLGTGIDLGGLTLAGSPQTATIQNDDSAAVTLTAVDASQVEGTGGTTTAFTFEVTLSIAVEGGFDLAYTTDDGTATVADGDYDDNDGTLEFAGLAEETHTITVFVNHDGKVEADETFSVALGAISNLGPGIDIGDITVAGSPQTGTIQNDDAANVTLEAINATQAEGTGGTTTEFTFRVTLDNNVQGGFSLDYNTNDDTAKMTDGDYVDNDGTLQFTGTAGEQHTITVLVNHDGKVEADEAFQVALGMISNLGDGLDAGDISLVDSPQTGTITNDDTADVTLTAVNASLVEGTSGTAAAMTFSVTLNNAVQGGFNLTYTTNDGTATVADGDYADNDGTLSFVGAAGESKSLTVLVNPDGKVEADETFQVALGGLSNLGMGIDIADITLAGSPQTGTIVNDDTAAVTLAAVNATQTEGTDGTTTDFTFSVTLDNAVQGGFNLAYTTDDGTATVADGDYAESNGTLSFAGTAGESQTIIVTVNHDGKVEADEVFQVALGMISNLGANIDSADVAVAGSPQKGTIQNDDTATVTLASVSASQTEGTDGTTTEFTFKVTLDNDVQGGFDLNYTTDDGTATVADGDYVDNDDVLQFTGTAGEERTITVSVNHDAQVETDEVFQVALGALSNLGVDPAAITLAGSPQTGTIQNDDGATVTLTALNASQVEGTGGSMTAFTFEVMLSNAIQGGFDLTYTTDDGTATVADGDYVDNDGILHFAGTAEEKHTITVFVNQDGKVEADEMFSVALGAISNLGPGVDIGGLILAGSPQTGAILNDDVATVALAAVDAVLDEGTGGTSTEFTFSVTLSHAVQGGFSLAYNTNDDSATTADGDYIDNDGTLQFAGNAGEIQMITVRVNHDAKVEADEVFNVALGVLSNLGVDEASIVLGTSQTGTIQNDDTATVTLTAVDATLAEGTGGMPTAFTFSVTVNNAIQGGFDLGYATEDGTATAADGDYVDNTGTLRFTGTAGEINTITVLVNQDSKLEADEVFQLALGALSNLGTGIDAGDITLAGSPQTGTIQNDDSATVTLTATNATQAEGTGGTTTEFTFSVTLDNAVQGGFDLAYTTEDGTATLADADYAISEGILQFAGTAGETQTITVLVNHDSKVEADEVFSVALGMISNLDADVEMARLALAGGPQTGTIQNDDSVTLTLEAGNAVQMEGTDGTTTEFTFSVTLSDTVQGGFDLSYTTNDGTATVADGDYVDNDDTLHFDGTADERHTITVFVNHDGKVEADEVFQVALGMISNLGAGLDAGDIALVDSLQTGIIQNDDSATVTLVVDDTTQVEGSGGGTTAFTFSVMLDKAVQGGFALDYTTDDGTATVADGDYIDNDGTLQFTGTVEETKTITVLVNRDDKVEADEVFRVALGALSNLGVDVAAIVLEGSPQAKTIENDDTATVTLVADSATAAEGTGDTATAFTFLVTLSNAVQGGFDLAYFTNDGTATIADGDYINNDDTLQFAGTAGETQTITVLVNHDSKVEADEVFQVALGMISNLGAGLELADLTLAGGPQAGTIQNDDSAAVTLTPENAAQVEGTMGTATAFTFLVTLSNAVQGGFDLAYHTNDGTATLADGDYFAIDDNLRFIGTEDETKTITVLVNHDSKVEADEIFQVALGMISNLALGIDPSDVTVAGTPQSGIIFNDDTAVVTLTAMNPNSQDEDTEEQAAEFTFEVTLSNNVQGGFNLAYTTNDGTATVADGDYIDNDGILQFAGSVGETKTISVQVNRDSKVEADEVFSVVLGALSNLGIDPTDISLAGSPQTATIQNNDKTTVTLAAVNAAQKEGTGGTTTAFTFSVTLGNAVQGGFDLNYTTSDGTATVADGDYVDNDDTLQFAGTAGEINTITVLVNHDAKVEANEVFQVALGALANLGVGLDVSDISLAGTPQTGTIQNDDAAGITIDDVTLVEGHGGTTAFTFTVTLNADVDVPVSVQFQTTDGTATAGMDYQAVQGSLVFDGTAGQQRQITVLVNGDLITERGESFFVDLVGVEAGGQSVILVDGRGQGSILNDDQIVVTGADAGGGPHVRVFHAPTGTEIMGFFAYTSAFRGGVRVAVGDVNNDGTPDIITGAGPSGGPHVRAFSGIDGTPLMSFYAFAPAFTGGVFVSSGDLNGDGFSDVVVGADAGGGPHVRAFSGADGSELLSFFAYAGAFTGGVRVAVGDVDGNQTPDVITGAGPGGGPHVRAFDGVSAAPVASFFAQAPNLTSGIYVSAADLNGDGRAEIITGAGTGRGPQIRVFSDLGQTELFSFFAFNFGIAAGVRVAAGDVTGDGIPDLIAGADPGGAPRVRVFDSSMSISDEQTIGGPLGDFDAYDSQFAGGVFVAASIADDDDDFLPLADEELDEIFADGDLLDSLLL